MARTPRIQLSKTAIAGKPHHWETEFFSAEDVERIVEESGVPFDGMVSKVSDGRKEEISRKDLLKGELDGLAHYWRWKLEMQRNPSKDEGEPVIFDLPKRGRKKAIDRQGADHLFDHLIFELGDLWTDHRVFNQKKVGTSIPSSRSDSKPAGGPFIRYAIACCKVLGIDKTPDAVRAVVRKSPEMFGELSKKTKSTRQNKRKKRLESIGLGKYL